jgi:hypothetical protein
MAKRRRKFHGARWTAQEDRVLRRNTNATAESLAAILHRSIGAVKRRRVGHGAHSYTSSPESRNASGAFRVWASADLRWLRKHKDDELGEMAAYLGRSAKAIRCKLFNMGLARRSTHRSDYFWSPQEDAVLRSSMQVMNKVVAERIGRSEKAVADRRSVLGLKRRPFDPDASVAYARWTASEDDFVRAHSACDAAETAGYLCRSATAIKRRCVALGIRRTWWQTKRMAQLPTARRIIKLREQGLTYTQIWIRMGIPPRNCAALVRWAQTIPASVSASSRL